MKTIIELPDHLMREVKVRAAQTDRKLKDVIAEFIQRGLETPRDPFVDHGSAD
jgi:plasmid stability protein